MQLLHDEICTPGFASTAMVESISEVLRIKLARLMRLPDGLGAESPPLGKLDIARVHDYIEAQNGRSPSVTELAKLFFNMSRRSLLRCFRSSTSMTVVSYITQVQLKKAKRLLATTDRLIKQIALESGFKSPSHFALAFERNVGLTPTKFRHAAQGEFAPAPEHPRGAQNDSKVEHSSRGWLSPALFDLSGIPRGRPAFVRFRHPYDHSAFYRGTFSDPGVPRGNVREHRQAADMVLVLIDPCPRCDVRYAV